jgi:uncharacterized protein (TIGR00290 family)
MKALIAWSSGKDCAYALDRVRRAGDLEVVGALTTVTDTFKRVSMHGVRADILHAQLAAAELEPWIVPIPYPCPNAVYESAMAEATACAKHAGITHIIFGDLFLRDVRAYRERMLADTGITPLFPLWDEPTPALAREMIASRLKATLVTVDLAKLPASFVGRTFDAALLADLPDGIDPCGENGEFHTCVTAGPMLTQPLAITTGEVVTRDGFAFCDLTLA